MPGIKNSCQLKHDVKRVAAITLTVCLTLTVFTAFTEDFHQDLKGPFYARRIEVTPGTPLMLRPRIYFEDGMPEKDYRLTLNLPRGARLNAMNLWDTDCNDRIDSAMESSRDVVRDGVNRREFTFQLNLEQIQPGIELCFYLRDEGFSKRTIMKFTGSFDWQTFEKEIVPSSGRASKALTWHDRLLGLIPFLARGEKPETDTIAMSPYLIQRSGDPSSGGEFSCRRLQIKDVETGQTVFDYKAEKPIVLKIEKDKQSIQDLNGTNLNLISGRKYLISCEAKSENIQNPMSIKDCYTNRVYYFRTMFFDVDPRINLPDKLAWRIENSQGKIFSSGEVALIPGVKPVAPKTLEASVWVCESALQREQIPVQKLYVEKFKAWGLNAIEPEMTDPVYDAPFTAEALVMPIAREARRLGLRARAYMHFLYDAKKSRDYLKANPQFSSIDPQNRKAAGYPYICPTHLLEGGKFDDPVSGAGAGKDNAWLGYYYQAIKKSVEINGLDGVFYDFEINAAPFIKSRPLADGGRRWGDPCICERCRRAFQAYAELDHTPGVEECCGDALYEKWVDFRCRQNAQLWQLTRAAAREGNPRATFSIYSGTPGDYCRQAYGVDWSMAAPVVDLAMQRYGVEYLEPEFPQGLKKVLAAGLTPNQKTPRYLIQLQVFLYTGWGDPIVSYKNLLNLKNNIIKDVANCGSFGWAFCGIWGMDDQLIKPIREANALLAKYEDYFVKGQKVEKVVEISGGKALAFTWENGPRLVTFVVNQESMPQRAALKHIRNGQSRELEVGAYDCAVYEWGYESAR